jgi:hypothetical protein
MPFFLPATLQICTMPDIMFVCCDACTRSARVKAIEDAPAAPAEGQPPICLWQAAGTRFAVQLRLARPLYAPWQPPARPGRQLADVCPAKAPPALQPAPTAADRFRAKVCCLICASSKLRQQLLLWVDDTLLACSTVCSFCGSAACSNRSSSSVDSTQLAAHDHNTGMRLTS